MAQSTNTTAARRDPMFPILGDADIERMRRFGEASSYAAGEHIVTVGSMRRSSSSQRSRGLQLAGRGESSTCTAPATISGRAAR